MNECNPGTTRLHKYITGIRWNRNTDQDQIEKICCLSQLQENFIANGCRFSLPVG